MIPREVMHGDVGWWWMGLVPMGLAMVLFWGALIWFAVWLVHRSDRAPSNGPPAPDARDILEERFARGEIDEEEFQRRSKVLAGAPR